MEYDDTGNKNEIYYTSEVIKMMVGGVGESFESTAFERFIQDIINKNKCDNSNEITISMDDIDSLNYNKNECELYITCCNENYKIDLIDGKIFLIDEEEELQSFDKLDLKEKNKIIQNAINNWNKFKNT